MHLWFFLLSPSTNNTNQSYYTPILKIIPIGKHQEQKVTVNYQDKQIATLFSWTRTHDTKYRIKTKTATFPSLKNLHEKQRTKKIQI